MSTNCSRFNQHRRRSIYQVKFPRTLAEAYKVTATKNDHS